jgi:hypothetical protein
MHEVARASAWLVGILMLAGSLHCAPAKATAPAVSEEPAVDPRAKASLAHMADYLRTLPSFTVHGQTTREEVVNGDFKIQRSSEANVTVKRPDRLRADVVDDAGSRTFVYDGRFVSLYTKPGNYLATAAAPPTIREMLDVMLERYAVELPLLDILYTAAGGDAASRILEAGHIGPSRIGGVECEHLAFRGPRADWQVWVERGPRPLPRKVVVTTRDDPTLPEFTALLRWDVSPAIEKSTFELTPPEGAQPIPFRPLAEAAVPPHR